MALHDQCPVLACVFAVHYLSNGLLNGVSRWPAFRVCVDAQVSFLQLVGDAFKDFTIIVLLIAGAASIGLETAFGKPGENGWVEGTAILAAVAVVVLVTAVNDFQKEKQFRELSALAEASEVCAPMLSHACACLLLWRGSAPPAPPSTKHVSTGNLVCSCKLMQMVLSADMSQLGVFVPARRLR